MMSYTVSNLIKMLSKVNPNEIVKIEVPGGRQFDINCLVWSLNGTNVRIYPQASVHDMEKYYDERRNNK